MFKKIIIVSLVLLSSISSAYADKEQEKESIVNKSFYDFSFTAIDGTPLPLSNFKDKLVLVVNTASRCGFTK